MLLLIRAPSSAQEPDTAQDFATKQPTTSNASAAPAEPVSTGVDPAVAEAGTKEDRSEPDNPSLQTEIDQLKARLEAEPQNLDVKFLLAARLSWLNQREQARSLAQQIVDANPRYIDAQVLLARLDYWDGRYQPALERILSVRSRSPENQDALRLWAQIQVAVAYQLSWNSATRNRAREMAFDVVEVYPDCWDAQILISRIDLWDGKTDHALVRISMVHAHQPKNQEALMVWAQVRLLQAQQRWNEGSVARARRIALEVADTLPDNWDAQLMVARIDARRGLYREALDRVLRILAANPRKREALELQADIGLWSANTEEASKALDRLETLNREDNADRALVADLYYRRAQLALQQGDTIKAYQLAGQALEADPTHKAARELRRETHLFTTDIAGHFEVYPIQESYRRYGGGTAITATLFPRSLNSLTLLYEYIYRFAAHNHRLTARTDWRVTNELTLMGSVRHGVVEVIPREGLQLGADYQLNETYGGGFVYILDAMKWPGMLHRFRPMARVNLPFNFNVDTHYTCGLLVQCGQSDVMHGVHIRTTWAPQPFEVYVQYDFGMELERLNLPAGYQEGLCPGDVPAEERYRFRIEETRYHEVGTQLLYHIDRQTLVRAGYSLQIRFEGKLVHMNHLGVRRWF